jgi:large conductance mechanosensitive channel
MGFIGEFKEFIAKGNVMDLAVGVVIGAAFGKIVTSLVADIIMPPIGYLTGGVDFAEKKVVLVNADITNKVVEVAIRYGSFINTIIQFTIIAFCIFMIIKVINKLKRKEKVIEEIKEALPLIPTQEQILLTEIRDLLKTK